MNLIGHDIRLYKLLPELWQPLKLYFFRYLWNNSYLSIFSISFSGRNRSACITPFRSDNLLLRRIATVAYG